MLIPCEFTWTTEEDLHVHKCSRKRHQGTHICLCGEMHFSQRQEEQYGAGKMMNKHSGS